MRAFVLFPLFAIHELLKEADHVVDARVYLESVPGIRPLTVTR